VGFKEKLVRLSELEKYRTDHLAEIRETWIRELNRLCKEIGNWFGEYPEQGCMSIEYCHLRGEYHGGPTVSTNMAALRASDWYFGSFSNQRRKIFTDSSEKCRPGYTLKEQYYDKCRIYR